MIFRSELNVAIKKILSKSRKSQSLPTERRKEGSRRRREVGVVKLVYVYTTIRSRRFLSHTWNSSLCRYVYVYIKEGSVSSTI